MKLLIDANILLDVLQDRKPFASDSSLVWKLCETKNAEGYISTLSFADLVYVMRKELDADTVESVYKKLALIFNFADLRRTDIEKAVSLKWDDFEDALQSVTAERMGADYIITRNINDFYDSKVPAIAPKEFIGLRLVGNNKGKRL